MLRAFLSIGDKIEIRLLNRKGIPLKNLEPYSSQLLDFLSNDIISIAMPIKRGETVILEPGIHYNLCFFTSRGLYQCNCQMLKSYRENNTLIAAVSITTELKKLQRRQYYRLELVHKIKYCLISEEELEEISQAYDEKSDGYLNKESRPEKEREVLNTLVEWSKDWKSAYTIDISGGGVKFNSNELLEAGDRILIKIEFNIKGILRKCIIGAKIIQSSRLENQANYYSSRAEFTQIRNRDREYLIKYIFEQEREMRKNNRY